jgi:hypothetical protein
MIPETTNPVFVEIMLSKTRNPVRLIKSEKAREEQAKKR